MAKAQAARTHCPQGHEYTPENTYHTGNGRRMCRACSLARSNAYAQRKRLEHHGGVLPAPLSSDPAERLDGLCHRQFGGGCWQWTGTVSKHLGYGTHVAWWSSTTLAHRLVYELLVGPIPEGLTLDHLCRNRACVNPDHLEPVTIAVNVMRGESPPARNARKTHCPRGHEYTPENTYVRKNGWRQCATCTKDKARARNKRKKGILA